MKSSLVDQKKSIDSESNLYEEEFEEDYEDDFEEYSEIEN